METSLYHLEEEIIPSFAGLKSDIESYVEEGDPMIERFMQELTLMELYFIKKAEVLIAKKRAEDDRGL